MLAVIAMTPRKKEPVETFYEPTYCSDRISGCAFDRRTDAGCSSIAAAAAAD
jgi:hypothetical protein